MQNNQRIPSYLDLKQILYRNPAFQPSTVLTLATENRTQGSTLNNPRWNLPYPVKGAYAISLKSLSLPYTWPNVVSAKTFDVTYGAVTAYPGDFTLPIGNYYYYLNGGTVTYATASALPPTEEKANLVYYILRWFNGGVSSISIDPSNGEWIWTWDPSVVTVTSTSADVLGFFKINYQTSQTWKSSATVDITGPKLIAIGCPDLAVGGYVSSATPLQSYLCTCPMQTIAQGDLLTHEPPIEHVTWFAQTGKFISAISLGIYDAATNELLPLQAEWSCELKVYIDRPQ